MIVLPIPPSVNSLFGQHSGHKRFISKKYQAWLDSCPKLFHSEINEPVSIHYKFYLQNKRHRDLDNMIKAINDYLVKSRVIADDNYTIVQKMIIEFIEIDKNNPRVEVDIIKLFPIG